MTSIYPSSEHLDYLQRHGLVPAPVAAGMPVTSAPSDELRRWCRIAGFSRTEKDLPPTAGQPMRMPSEDVLVGVYGYKIPLAFAVCGRPDGVAVYFGTWSSQERERAASATLDARQAILNIALGSLYPAIEITPTVPQLPQLPLAGLVLGTPSVKPPEASGGARVPRNRRRQNARRRALLCDSKDAFQSLDLVGGQSAVAARRPPGALRQVAGRGGDEGRKSS